MADRFCEFCNAPVIWTEGQIALDKALAASPPCTGLGCVCNDCDEKIVQIAIRDEQRFQLEEAKLEQENG